MSTPFSKYIGRFAPTPSGPLHLGSIITALASFLDARSNAGKWLLRIDDLDTPRLRPGATDSIFFTLDSLNLHWDDEVLYQSHRLDAYHSTLETLHNRDLTYACFCSRQKTKGRVYPGTCRDKLPGGNVQHSIRIKTDQREYILRDLVQLDFSQNLALELGDFIIRRADGIIAYHLAVVVDDAFQNITHMVRGADLMDSCPRQIYLQNVLNLKTPQYAHVPLAVYKDGTKLSKRFNADHVLLEQTPGKVIFYCLEFLGQKPPAGLLRAGVNELVEWGKANWDLRRIPGQTQAPAPSSFQNRDQLSQLDL